MARKEKERKRKSLLFNLFYFIILLKKNRLSQSNTRKGGFKKNTIKAKM
jgi:hypothetical protein